MSASLIRSLVVACWAATVTALSSWRRLIERREFGTVSERWLAEQRNHRHSSER